VGISVQLPGGGTSDDLDYSTLWEFLLKGGKAYEPLETIFPELARYDGEHANLPLSGCFLKNATSFDNVSFAISTRDARVIPNSARRLLDLSFLALQDAGINSKGQRIGGFMCGNRDIIGQDEVDTDGSFSWMMCGMANRASYALDLTGPSVYLDTACSSSLTGFHLAVNAIEKGDCSAAIVGAAQTNRDMREWKAYAQGGVLSPDGMCKPMDDSADGFGRGEGAVVVVLKRLDLAIQDNDHIYCVVAGSSINATGSQMPLNVPNAVAQQRCITEAYKRAGLGFEMADYVELHATGTSVGDPIEANMAGSLFARNSAAKFGSIKGNIGHLEVTAFLASVAKACLMFEHGIIPPTVNFAKPSLGIRWGEFQGTVPVEPVPLGNQTGQPVISMTSAGLGGSTGHVVLRAAPTPAGASATQIETTDIPVLFIVGGLSPNAANHLAETASQLAPRDLPKFAVTLARRARQVPWRTFFILPSPESLLPPPSLILRQAPSPVFVFSGQGPQHYAMGRQLFAKFPAFRATILELDAVYRRVEGVSLVESTGLFDSSPLTPTVTLSETSWPVVIILSALAMVQMAMFDLLTSLGVVPDMMLGHSAGETIALYASGAGSKEMAMEIAIARGKAMTMLEEQELGMAALACSSAYAAALASQVIEGGNGALEVSCFNAPQSVVLSGDVSQLDKVVALAKSRNIFAQRLRTKIPNHSSFMDLIRDDYTTRMADIFSRYPGPHTPRIPVFSSCRRGQLVADFTPDYFWENCRNEVLFSDAVTKILDSHSTPIFLEICCHPVLASSLSAHGIPEERSLCPMRRSSVTKPAAPSGEITLFLETIGRLSLLGINSIDLTNLYGRGASPMESKLVEHPLARRQISPPRLRGPPRVRGALRTAPLAPARLSINTKTHPDLAEHVINGESILPATGFIEILLEAGASFLWDVEFLSILSLASDSLLDLEIQRANSTWSIRTGSGSSGRQHARGCMDDSEPPQPSLKIDLGPIWQRLPALNLKGFYSSLQPMASYGTRFQRVVRCHGGPSENVFALILSSRAQGYLLHPVLMDSCLHALLHPDVTRQNPKSVIYLPSRLGYFTFYRRTPTTGNWFVHITLKQWTPDTLVYDMTVTDSSGAALCELRSFAMKKLNSVAPLSVKRRFDLVFQPVVATVDIPPRVAYNNDSRCESVHLEVSFDSADVYLYEFGKEIALQAWLRAYNWEVPQTLYLAAVQGRDADAATGLCVVLRKELPLWNILLCVFEPGADIVSVLAKNKWVFESGEDTVFFTSDGAHVTRLVLGRSPPISSPQTGLTVRVSHWAGMSSSYDGFVGHVESPSHPNFPRDSLVGGVAVKVAAGVNDVPILVHNAGLVLGPVRTPMLDLAKDILGSVVASFVAEDGALSKRILVALHDAELLCDVQKRVVAGMAGSKLVRADFTDVNSFQCVDILLCDSETYSKNPHLRRWIARDGKLIIWDTLLKQSRQQDPNFMQRAIAKLGYEQNLAPTPLLTPPSNSLRCASPPFRSDGVYVLLGGIGGLGVDLAVWMYQASSLRLGCTLHGAKHLVLTSRRGIASLDPVNDTITLAKIGYLSGLEDLQLQLEACDGTRADQMRDLIRRLPKSAPIAGCFLMALILSDATFFNQTRATLDAVYDSKVKMLEIFASEVDIASLDFFVALSSLSGLVGIAGQANYASACTTVDGILAGYKNAFSLITPGISDVGFLVCRDRASSNHIARKDRFGSITAETLWTYLEDGLRKLDDAPFNQYIPDLDWDSLETHLTLPGTCRHLLQRRRSDFIVAGEGIAQEKAGPNILRHVLELLEVPAEEFDADQPLSVYGLDSITAAKVATELRPYAAVSQMQLLGGATWSNVLAIINATAAATPSINAILFETLGTTSGGGPAVECIVEICGGEGTPLIILPGANGSATLFFGLQDTFRGPLWAIQITDSTPLESMTTLVAYWKTQICAKRPNGPYRFAAYSASVVPSVALVKLFEDVGEEVVQLTFIDNTPTVWIHETCEALLRKQSAADFRTLSDELVLDMLKNDPSTSPATLTAYEAAIEDRTYTPFGARTELTISRTILTLTFEFLEGFYPASDDRSYATFIRPFEAWLASLRAPLAVILAEFGMLLSTPCRGWPDLGASRFPGRHPVKENLIAGVGHYSLFRHEIVATLLGEYSS
ncbi:hypothetical protein B0H16DRAFT_1299265, partial [Mycena metata]